VLLEDNEPEEYAGGIPRICGMCIEPALPCAASVKGANLRKRIEQIPSNRLAIELSLNKTVALAAAAVAALTGPVLFGVVSAPVIRAGRVFSVDSKVRSRLGQAM
jgi:hypothetical protein